MSLLGIDVGTTGCKAVAYSLDGQCLAQAYREYALMHPKPGWAELDARGVWDGICDVIRQVTSQTKRDPVEAISVSSLGEAMVPVTRDREIVGNSIVCNDCRGQAYIDELASAISQEEFYRINPNIPGIGYSMPKLRWLRDNAPIMFERADWFLLWADFVCFMLGADAFASTSLACRTLLFDLEESDWSDRLLELSGLSDLRPKLPPVKFAGQQVGSVFPDLARELGLTDKVSIIVGGHDQCCNALGAGVYDSQQAVYGIGTFECVTQVFDELPQMDNLHECGLGIEHHVMDGRYVTFVYNQGGTLVRWFRDTFGLDLANASNIYGVLCKELPVEPTELFTLPYFEPTGPPEYISDASGAILGLRSNTSRGEILKSIMESVTYYMFDALHTLDDQAILPRRFVATGGGAKSDAWLQIKADIFGIPFVRNNTTECSALGAALLAGLGSDLISQSLQELPRFVKNERVFQPDMDRHHVYQERLSRYQAMVEGVIHKCLRKGH